ncbi:enolase C-terminal domain-like protein [Halobellus salinisoli]|uniref:enolase C-terminal domain-like protein n=1 Tax=Halobellus salinisoli TaxID=3108500 RepID=UPI00300A6872
MRITEVEVDEFTYLLNDVGNVDGHITYDPGSVTEPRGFVLTIRTADGTEGHYRGFMMVPPMVTQIEMSAGQLIGRSPLEREAIWQDLWQSLRHTDHFGVGPIDIALWDLAGKHYGESVSALLGGFRDSVPAYASTNMGDESEDGLNSPEGYANFAEECRDKGYPSFKIHPFGDPDRDVDVIRAVAEAVGDEMDLMLDPADGYETYADALKVGRVLDECEYFWYEDPTPASGHSTHLSARLSDQLQTPLVGGEHVRTGPTGTADLLAENTFEFIRADGHLDGGITGVMKLAHVAESFGADVELHAGGPAHLHCISAIRNTNYFEHALLHPKVTWKNNQALVQDVEIPDSNGRVAVPDGDGLGVDIDWDFVGSRRTGQTRFDSNGMVKD